MPHLKTLLAASCIVSGLSSLDIFLSAKPAEALTLLGDVIPSLQAGGTIKYIDGGGLFLSTNALQEEDGALGNAIGQNLGNIYNLSRNFINPAPGNPAISAFDLETALGLPDGYLSPDIDNFIEAIEGSALTQRLFFPDNLKYTFGWTFFTNEGVIPSNTKPDYAFALIRNLNNPLNPEFITLASSTDSNLVPSNTTLNQVIETPFLQESSGRVTRDFTAGTYEISFGVLDVIDGNDTSALAVWVPDYGDHKEFYRTLRRDNGPFYLESEFQRLGIYKDDEIDGQPDLNASRDDISDLDGFSVRRDLNPVDDEDGVTFNPIDSTDGFWAEVTFNINRPYDPNNPEASDYQIRGWFNRTLLIDDIVRLAPGLTPSDPAIIPDPNFPNLFRKRYDLPIDPNLTFNRFRLTWNPADLNVLPEGEFFSQGDSLVSHGEVEDYSPCANNPLLPICSIPIPESRSLLGLLGVGIYGFFRKFKNRIIL